MANSDKNIRIQPNRNSTLFPKITFTGQSNNPITLNVLDDNSISFEGSAGQLFSINNNLSSGYIFSVNDISGLPSFRINADGTVGIAEFYGNVGIGITNPSYKFHARGDSYFSSTGNTALLLLSGTGGTIIASNSVNITLTDPARKGLVINAASLQTANIFEWYADGGVGAGYSLAGRIRPSGHVNLGNTGTITMSTGTSALLSLQGRGSTEGLAIRGFNSNLNEPLFEVQGNPGNQLFGIYGDGGVNAPRINVTNGTASTTTTNGALVVTGGVGIGGTLNAGSVNVLRDFNHTPNITTVGGASGWVASTASPFINPSTFRYLNNKYIGIGGTYIYYSDDMINWSSVMVPNLDPARNIANITYGEGKYVFVQYYTANAGYSTNLTNWTNVAITYQTWNDVIYGNGRFVATAGGDIAAHSLDGTSWNSVTDSRALGFNTGLKFINGYFYVTNANAISRSIDGITWQVCNTPAIPYGLAYGNGLYVGGVYNSGTVVYSYDGLNFSSYSGSSFVHNNSFFYNGVYYLTTQNNQVIRYSTDGFNWTNSTGFPAAVNNLQYAQGRLYAGSGNTVWVTNATPGRFEVNPSRTGTLDDVEIGRLSPNNANFIDVSVNNNLNVSSQYDSASYLDGALTVAGGVGIGKTLNTNSARVLNNFNHTPSTGSTGGITWTSVAFPSIPGLANNGFDNSVVYGRDKFVGIGGTNVFYSYDSYNWFYAPIASATTPRSITYGNDMYIAINNTGNGAYYSYNGINWSTTTLANSTANGDKACFGNGRFVYNDQSGNVGISTNGINWTITSVFSGAATPYGVDYANGWFFARWQNNYFRSADLINWNRFSLPADSARSKIFFSKNKYYAPNNNASTYFVSDDGFNWTTQAVTNALWINMYDYFGTLYLIRSSANAVSYSEDGINWATASLGGTSNTNATGLVYGNGRFVYVGSSPNLIFSGNAPVGVSHINTPRTSEVDNVRIGANSPASAQVTGLNALGSVNFSSTTNSTSPFNGALTVAGGVGIGASINIGGRVGIGTNLLTSTFNLLTPTSSTIGAFIQGRSSQTADFIDTANSSGIINFSVGANGNVLINLTSASSKGLIIKANASQSVNLLELQNSSASPLTTFDQLGNLNISSTTASGSTSTGALVVAGGVGIGGTLTANDVNVVSRLTSFASFGSTGGLNWSSATVPANYTEPFNSIVYGNGKFAAIGNTAVLISTDAINWEVKNISWPVTPTSPSIYFLNAKFIIKAGNSSYIAYSDDAVTWQTTTTAISAGNLVYNGGRYYKYSGSTVGISTNLTNWTTQTSNGSPYRVLNGYFYNNSQRSIDGINFESLVFPGTTPTDINYGNGIYFGAVYNSSIYYTSTDGLNFTQSTIESNVYLGAEYYNGVYYLRCQHNIPKLYYSLDGYNYSSVNLFTNQYNLSMAFGNNKIVYIGYNPSQVNFLAYSDATSGVVDLNTKFEGSIDNVVIGRRNARSASFLDVGISGKIVSNNTASSSTLSNNSAVFAGGVGIGGTLTVVGSVNVSNSLNLVNSTTGIATTWTRTVVGTAATISYLAYANNLYVGVGYSSLTSTDGVNWTTRTLPHNLSAVAFGNGIWSGLLSGSALGATSTNGTSWTSYAMTNSRAWRNIVYGNGIFVTLAGGSNIAAYSLNGYNWTEVTMPTSQVWQVVIFGGGYFAAIANASATAVYSTDGINWNITTLPSASGWNCITYGNGYFYVTASSGGGVYSRDLINWTSYAHTISGSAFAAYKNGAFVVVDVSGATRTNIITGDFTSRTQIDLPGPQIPTTIVAGDRNFIAGYGQTFYTFPIPNNSITLFPNTTGEINNVKIGAIKPAAGNFSNIFSQGLVAIGATTRSTTPFNGSLTVSGGVGIGGTLNANSVVTYNRLQNQSFSGSSVGASDGLMGNFSSNYQYQSYGNGIYVVSSNGANNARYSTDGVTWQNTTLPVNQAYPINFYGNGYFVLSASGSTTVLYSTNGNSWSQVSIGNTFDRTSGVYGNGKYIIVGSGSTYNYSSNLTTWSSATLPYNSNWYITYGNGMFVALGNGTRNLLYSYDGLNWSLGNVNTASGPWSGIKYGNGVFVASSLANPLGNTSGTIYSYDGINWYQGSISNQDFYNVSYGNGVYFGNNQNAFWTSTDGANWSSVTSFMISGQSFQSAYAYNKFNTIGRWVDGPTNTVTLEPKFTGEINNVRIGAITPASGDFTNLSSTGSANLVGTVNANNLNIISKVNQTPVLGGFAGTNGWASSGLLSGAANYGLAFGNGLFVSIRKTTNSTSFSSDGKRWVASNMPFAGDWMSIAWGVDKFVAVASAGTTGAYSGNGISWTSMSMPATAQGWYAVTYGDDKFVAVGNTSTTAYSSDGITWTGSSIANTNWTGVAYGNGTFVAVSGFGLSGAYSYDGINWNLINLPTNGGTGIKFITYGNGYFIVANYVNNDINYSRDGINWSTTVRTSTYGIKTDIAYGNGIYSIFNYQEATYSYDGVNWLLGNTIAATDWQAVAYGNNRFVATSVNTGQVGSIDGPSNTLNLHPKFTGDIDNVRIGAKQPAAAEFTNLAAQQPVRFTANTNSTDSTSGALVVLGGVGIGGSVNSTGLFNFGTLQAPSISSLSGFGTGGLSPSTTYYYKLSAIDYNNNESLPSPEYSVTTSASQYGTRFFINTSPGASGYKLYRTTTSGNYANSFVQTYRTYQQLNNYRYDVGKATSAGSPVSRATGNTVTLGSSSSVPFNVLPSLTIPSGSLQVKSPNVTSFATPGGTQAAIETGTLDYVAIRDPFGYGGLSVSTGGTLTPGQTYYYVATIVDHYGNESLPTEELGITVDAGGAVVIGFNVLSVQVPAFRIYRTTTPGNYTNSYLGELPGNKDIGYPTMSGSPPTTTSFAGIRLNPRADFDVMSYIPNIDLAPSHRNGFLRKLDVPYTGAIAVTTSGTAGSLLPNTTYYYKCSAFDIFGGSAYPTAEVSVSTGTSTAVTISGGGGILYAKVYRSTTKNNYSNVPTYLVNSFPFTDRGDTTFTDTPSNVSTYIQSQLFRNQNNAVPQNYLRDLSIGPILNNFPFSILAPTAGLNSVTASTGGTLVEGQVYYYVMEAVDVYNFGSSSGQPIRFVATAGGAANVSQFIVGGYGYVAWNLYRTSNLASWTNSLIAAGIKGTSFIDIGYPGRSGSPNFGYHRARNVVYDNRGVFHIPTIANQFYGQNITAPSAPYRTGGNSSGSLTTNTTYYYRVMPYGGANQSYGYASDEFQYTTGANEKSISMTIGGHKIGAMYYRVYRSTTFNNFTNAYYFETPHTSFIDYGHTALQTTGDVFINNVPYANTVNILNQASGNYLAYTTITGQTGGLKIHLKSPVISSISSGTGGTLSTNTDYWYKVDAIDAYGVRTFVSDEAYINTGANNSVTLTWDDVPGAYYYRVFRATASQTFSNKLIASYVSARTFTDLNFPATTGTPVTIFENGQNGNTAALFQMDNTKYFGIMPRTIISNIDSSQANWYTDFSLRITSPAVPSASAALLQVGAGFTNLSSAGFNGSIYGTQIAIGAAVGFTGSLLDAQTAGISRFRINFDGSATIGSTTGSTSTTSGALIVSGGVGIGGSLNIGSDVIINGGRESNSTSTGSLIVRGGVGVTGGLYVKPFSLSTKGLVVQANTSQSGNLFELQNSASSTITSFNSAGELNITSTTGSTSSSFGSIVTAGGVGIGGSVSIGSTAGSSNTTSGALKVSGGVGIGGALNVGGSVNFSSSIFGGVSTSIVPTMTFIGPANDPITLSVLSDNSLSFDGSSGQLFSINNNLSTGWIFSISDISGLPLFRTNADGTVSMGEFGGNVGIGLTNPTYKLQVAGRASIGNTLFVSGNAHFGTEAYRDAYGLYYSPTLTVTDNFAGDTGIQIQNKSSDLNARSGIQIFNDANDYFSMHLGSSDYAGIGQSFAYIDTFRFLEVNAGDGMLFRTGSGNAIRVVGAGVTIVPVTESTSTTTGSLVVNGGAGIAKSLNVGGYLSSKPAYITAGLAATQTLTSGADNLILFTDNSDPNAWWTGVAGSGVSHRFKPNIAGLYFVSAQVHFLQGTGSGQMYIQARKNGNTFSLSRAEVVTNANGLSLNLSGTTSLDGNTDYIDFAVFTAGTQNIHGEADRAWSQATIYKIF